MATNRNWTTDDEINFLKKIDKILPKRRVNRSKLELLLMYRYAMRRRVNWDRIDKERVKVFLNEEILRTEREEAERGSRK